MSELAVSDTKHSYRELAANLAKKRLIRDFKKLQVDSPKGIFATPVSQNIMYWKAMVFGPKETPWEGGIFGLQLCFDNEYPNRPPKVKFLRDLFHPNIYTDGHICLDVLQKNWSPTFDILTILTSVQSLLTDPNPNSPANQEAAFLYVENRFEYNRRIRKCVLDSLQNVDIFFN